MFIIYKGFVFVVFCGFYGFYGFYGFCGFLVLLEHRVLVHQSVNHTIQHRNLALKTLDILSINKTLIEEAIHQVRWRRIRIAAHQLRIAALQLTRRRRLRKHVVILADRALALELGHAATSVIANQLGRRQELQLRHRRRRLL